MRDDIFDTYLRSIMNKSDRKKEGTEENTETASSGSDLPDGVENETEGGTISFEKGSVIATDERLKPAAQEEIIRPVIRGKRKRIRKANYSAYGGIVLATLVICCSIIISLFVIVVGRDFLGIDTDENRFTLYIESNWTISDIADYLYENGIIQYPKLFTQYAKLQVGDGAVYPGDIEVKRSMSYPELIEALSEARDVLPTVTVTFTEGLTIDDCARILEENEVCSADEFIFAFNTNIYGFDFESHVSSSGMKYYKYEGYLFPDTYEFYVGDSVYNIVRKIKERTDEIMNADFIRECQDAGRTVEEVITMASILQLESGVGEEMKNIASVFYNRLEHPDIYPRLQTDATNKYIEVIKKGSMVELQEMIDAYDTYVCQGLPAGPICNPGKEAIDAALHPNETNYYFFCSSAETGEFYYAETYAEHQENIKAAGLEV